MRRFDQFEYLSQQLAAYVPGVELPGFPEGLFSGLFRLFTPVNEINNWRRTALEQWLRDLNRLDAVRKNLMFRLFFDDESILPRPSNNNDFVVVITGSNTGVGFELAKKLSKLGAHVVMACRSLERSKAPFDEVKAQRSDSKVTLMQFDAASFKSTRAFADEFLKTGLPLHRLVLNAGLGRDVSGQFVTEDGFDTTFEVNYLSQFLLYQLLEAKLIVSKPSRVVFTSSIGHLRAAKFPLDDASWKCQVSTGVVSGFRVYSESKFAQVLQALEIQERLGKKGVTAVTLHPGGVNTKIWDALPAPVRTVLTARMITAEQGATALLIATLNPKYDLDGGVYLNEMGVEVPFNPLANDVEFRRALWVKSEEWTAAFRK